MLYLLEEKLKKYKNKVIRKYLKKFCELDILERHSKKIRDKEAIFIFKK